MTQDEELGKVAHAEKEQRNTIQESSSVAGNEACDLAKENDGDISLIDEENVVHDGSPIAQPSDTCRADVIRNAQGNLDVEGQARNSGTTHVAEKDTEIKKVLSVSWEDECESIGEKTEDAKEKTSEGKTNSRTADVPEMHKIQLAISWEEDFADNSRKINFAENSIRIEPEDVRGWHTKDINLNTQNEMNYNNCCISFEQSQSSEVKALLQQLARINIDDDERSIDEKRLSRTVRDAGEYTNGVVAVEVWVLDEETGQLKRPPSGWWRDESLASKSVKSPEEREALRTFEERSHPDFVHFGPVSPGVDIAGEIWVDGKTSSAAMTFMDRLTRGVFSSQYQPAEDRELDNSIKSTRSQQARRKFMSTMAFSRSYDSRAKVGLPSSRGIFRRGELDNSTRSNRSRISLGRSIRGNEQQSRGAILWRDILSLVNDPDKSKTSRLANLQQAGVGLAAGVHFHVGGHSGMVIYFAKSDKDTDVLTELPNQVYMIRMAEIIGGVVASTDARRAAAASKHQHTPTEDPTENLPENSPVPQPTRCGLRPIRTWLRKSLGGNSQIPPSMPLTQALLTLIGAFSSLTLVSVADRFIISSFERLEDVSLIIPPFGALVTLQYGLTAAPASQPRNIIFGQSVAGAIALAFTYIPNLYPWLRIALAPAVAISVTAKLGIIHPPAGAAAVVLASGNFDWIDYLLILLLNVILLVPAIAINNISQKRQYPTYWGIPWSGSKSLFSQLKKNAK